MPQKSLRCQIPYRQDEEFLRSDGLFDSLVSCSHRVETWIEEFRDRMPTPQSLS
jgi:hypothetical protein